jgi:hypothetical protein
MLVPFTVATEGEVSAGVARLPESVFGWQAANPTSPARRRIRE